MWSSQLAILIIKLKIGDNNFMQQVIDVTATAEQVHKNRKLRLMRANTNMQGDAIKPTLSRLKSSNQTQEQQLNKTRKLPLKPRSSIGKRPSSSRKLTETNHSVATTASSAKSEEQVKQLIGSVLTYSKKLQNFIKQNEIDEQTAYNKLANNEIFTLSLVGMISNQNKDGENEQLNKYVERCCIHKLERILAMDKQRNLCESIESKIGNLIQQRIKHLSHFS